MKELRLPNVNHISLSGRLTKDVELRYTTSGTAVASLSLASSRKYKKDGEWKEDTNYIDVVVWNGRAEQCASELSKGSAVLVDGYLQTRTYTNKENQNRKITEIVAMKIHFLEKISDSLSPQKTDNHKNNDAYNEDDVPF